MNQNCEVPGQMAKQRHETLYKAQSSFLEDKCEKEMQHFQLVLCIFHLVLCITSILSFTKQDKFNQYVKM